MVENETTYSYGTLKIEKAGSILSNYGTTATYLPMGTGWIANIANSNESGRGYTDAIISSSGLRVRVSSGYGSGFRPDAFAYINLSNVDIKNLGYTKLCVGPCTALLHTTARSCYLSNFISSWFIFNYFSKK